MWELAVDFVACLRKLKKGQGAWNIVSAGLGRRRGWSSVKGDHAEYYGCIRNEDMILRQ